MSEVEGLSYFSTRFADCPTLLSLGPLHSLPAHLVERYPKGLESPIPRGLQHNPGFVLIASQDGLSRPPWGTPLTHSWPWWRWRFSPVNQDSAVSLLMYPSGCLKPEPHDQRCWVQPPAWGEPWLPLNDICTPILLIVAF